MCPYAPPADLEARRDEIVALWLDYQKLREEHAALLAMYEALQKQVEKKKSQARGNVSERRKRATKATVPVGETDDEDGASEEPARQPGHGPREQRHLEEREQVFELDSADRTCKACGGQLDEWEGQAETSTEIDVEPRVYVRRRIIKKKYRCRCGACIETAPGPLKLIAGGSYSLKLAVEVAHEKYAMHAPLERQARAMRRAGLEIESQTLWDQTNALGFAYEPAYEAIWRYVLAAPWVGADDTSWPMLGGGGKSAGKPPWNAWVVHRGDAVVYMIDGGRTYEQAKTMLDGYQGVVVCDGHNAFEQLAQKHPGIVLAQCWAHCRRKYLDCVTGYPEASREMLSLIAEMYALEETLPRGREHDDTRKQMRQTHTRGVLEKIEAWVYRHALSVPKESLLRKATAYMVKRWQPLTRFVDDPRLPLDNNGSEREARAPALGRKNHYGSRTRRGAEVAAYMYTLVETAILSGVEPKTYMLLCAQRSLEDRPVVLPHQLTVELLTEELGLTREAAERALAYRPPLPAAAT